MNNSIKANLFSPHVIYYYFICMMKLIIKLLENDELCNIACSVSINN